MEEDSAPFAEDYVGDSREFTKAHLYVMAEAMMDAIFIESDICQMDPGAERGTDDCHDETLTRLHTSSLTSSADDTLCSSCQSVKLMLDSDGLSSVDDDGKLQVKSVQYGKRSAFCSFQVSLQRQVAIQIKK